MRKQFALLLFALLLAISLPPSAFAQSAELGSALDSYYAAVQSQDVDAFLAAIIIHEEDTLTRDAVQMLFDEYPQKGITWTFADETFYNGGDSANMVFDVQGTIVESSTGKEMNVGDRFIALFEKRDGGWKIWRIMPLADFTHQVKGYYDMIETASKEAQEEWDLLDTEAFKKQDDDKKPGLIDTLILAVEAAILLVVALIVVRIILGLRKKPKEKPAPKETVVAPAKPPEPKPAKKPAPKPAAAPAAAKAGGKKAVTVLGAKGVEKPAPAPSPPTKKGRSDAMKLLRKRFASGEITKEQFVEMEKMLED